MEPAFDVQQDEFGDRLTKIEKMVEDTNKQVRGMRRAQRVRTFTSILWKIAIFAAATYAYYFYVWPYVEQVMGAYQTSQDWQNQVQGFFGQYFGTSTRQ
jgi:predicted MFS family arabinose efflux permease